jgi:hypothetical protein
MAFVSTGYFAPSETDLLQGAGLAVNGDSSLLGNVTIAQNLNVSGATTIQNLIVNGSATFNGDLTVTGLTEVQSIKINGHIITAGDVPQIAAGNTDVAVTIEGNDTAGTITVTVNQPVAANAVISNTTFANEFTSATKPRVIITAINGAAVESGIYADYDQTSNTGFTLITTKALGAGAVLRFNYMTIQ